VPDKEEVKLEMERLDALLSNERTLMSYLRTAANAFILAIALFKFFANQFVHALGIASLAAGAVILTVSIFRYRKNRQKISMLKEDAE